MTDTEQQSFFKSRVNFAHRPKRWSVVAFTLLAIFTLSSLYVSNAERPPTAHAKKLWKNLLTPTVHGPEPYLRDATRPGAITRDLNRTVDLIDSFQNFTQRPGCTFTSLELHDPFSPLCSDRQSLLAALTDGGRQGLDAPYAPRGCDMRWFTTGEICRILSKFDQINVLGDSMMRNLAIAMHVYLRMDLYEGGRSSWAPDPDDLDCHCYGAFSTGRCLFFTAHSSKLVWENDPNSMACPRSETALVEYSPLLGYPLDPDDLRGLQERVGFAKRAGGGKPRRPHVFVMGHGLWNDLDENATHRWTNQVEGMISKSMPFLFQVPLHAGHPAELTSDLPEMRAAEGAAFPRLFITPSAAGPKKPAKFLQKQGNDALQRFEVNMAPWLKNRGYDHLGTFNLTIQNSSPDGTHCGFKANMIKAMMVFNWLDMIDVSL